MIPDLDYTLGWFLAGLSKTPKASSGLCFKGGTCLRKCYFPGYRFSEDLDFTAIRSISANELDAWIAQIADWSTSQAGPDFTAAPHRLEVIEDEYGSESFQIRVYYRGPLRWGGSPRAIRLDITRDESLLWPVEGRPLYHPYSDTDELGEVLIPCYTLREIFSEKVRAVCGQRRFAIARDVYDIHRLIQAGVAMVEISSGLPEKFRHRGADLNSLNVAMIEKRRQNYELSWHKQLDYLIPDSDLITFEEAWKTIIEVIDQLERLRKE